MAVSYSGYYTRLSPGKQVFDSPHSRSTPLRLTVRTLPLHGRNTSSNLVGVTRSISLTERKLNSKNFRGQF